MIATVGRIEGITRALESIEGVNGLSDLRMGQGYFTPTFIKQHIESAKTHLDILAYRNRILSNVDTLEAMHAAAKRSVKIRILALSSEASDTVLAEACKILPKPAVDSPDELRDQLRHSEKLISSYVKTYFAEEERSQIEYRGYIISPNMHLVRRDAILTLGFIGTLVNAQPNAYSERPYIEVPVRSELGQELVTHFDLLWQLSVSLR